MTNSILSFIEEGVKNLNSYEYAEFKYELEALIHSIDKGSEYGQSLLAEISKTNLKPRTITDGFYCLEEFIERVQSYETPESVVRIAKRDDVSGEITITDFPLHKIEDYIMNTRTNLRVKRTERGYKLFKV